MPDINGYKDDIAIILKDKQNTYCYSNVSLIEIKWQYIKLERSRDMNDLQAKFNRFQHVLLRDKRLILIPHTDIDINLISDQVRNEGHVDYFDAVIAASSLWYCNYLVTEDTILKDRINNVNNKYKHNKHFEVLSWKELRKKLLEE